MFCNSQEILEIGLQVLKTESQAILNVTSYLDNNFVEACEYFLKCQGRVIVTGMGKSGHIGKKISATLASTGTPAMFVHPGEASHGDLGMFTGQDVVLALSNSGETAELKTILPLIKRLQIPMISITNNENSSLAKASELHLFLGKAKEAGQLKLAPTSSTTAALALGDALAIAVLEARGFTKEDFALSHPGGQLGKQLLLKITDIMHTGDNIPRININDKLTTALIEMTSKRLGMTAIIENTTKRMVGMYTDGDLRRTIDSGLDIHKTHIKEVMITNFKYIKPDMLATNALQMMHRYKINSLPVINDNEELVGALNIHDLLKSGVI